ncbi:MAG: hypothetical protein E7311_06850 [Clostridiales bacterium]|nr:hypothetical protein [Clostridiales bacterium]
MKKTNEGMYRTSKISMIVTYFVRLVLICLFIRGCVKHDHANTLVIILTFILTYFPSILKRRFGVYLPIRLEITITVFLFAAQVLGEIHGFYDKISWWDTMLHTTTGIILGLVGFLFVYLLNENGDKNVNLSPVFVVIVAFCFAMTLGVFWEFFEYGSDRLFGYNMQKFRLPGQDGLVDTMDDLIVDAVGSLVACIFGWIYMKKKKDTLFNDYFDEWFESERIKNESKTSEEKL